MSHVLSIKLPKKLDLTSSFQMFVLVFRPLQVCIRQSYSYKLVSMVVFNAWCIGRTELIECQTSEIKSLDVFTDQYLSHCFIYVAKLRCDDK